MALADDTAGTRSRGLAAALLSAARRRRGLTQRELARAARVPQSTVAAIESGRRQPSVAMLERLLRAAGFGLETRLVNTIRPSVLLERHHEALRDVLARFPVKQAWVFGSVARGDDRPDSDLDLLIQLEPDASVIDVIGLDEELSAALGCPVDLITTSELESNELLRRGVNRHRRALSLAA